MQGKELAFPWIPLVESGLFNGLQRIQIKKSHGPGFLQFVSAIAPCPRSQTPLATRINRASNNNIAHILTFEKTMCARDQGDGLCVSPFRMGGVGGPVEATAFGPKPPRPQTAGRISWIRSSRARDKVAAVKLRELYAMRVSLNTAELLAFHRLNFPRKPSFCDEDHSAPRKLILVEMHSLSR
jgi:hypothetical protein